MAYQTYKKNVPLGPGEVLKFRKGKGYYAAPAQTDPQQARAQVQAILGPQTAALNTAYRNQGAGLNAAYGAVAEMQKGVAPAIQGTYDAASARQAVIGKGFADGFKMASGGAAEGLNKLLAEQGSPQTVTGAGEAGANVLYGLGGALPAGELNQQGAAFASAAEFLPAQSRLLGLDSLKASEQARIQAVRELEAKRPELVQSVVNQILEGKRADRNLNIQQWYLKNALRKTGAEVTGIDPVTGQPTAAMEAATGKSAASKAATRAKAVNKRNDATVSALDDVTATVETAFKAGTTPVEIGRVPVEAPAREDPNTGVKMPQWYTKSGGLTTNINDPNILTEPKYETQPLPKPAYDALFKKVYGELFRKLRRFGYKKAAIKAMAFDVLDDYYTVVGGQAANPTVKAPGSGPGSSPR